MTDTSKLCRRRTPDGGNCLGARGHIGPCSSRAANDTYDEIIEVQNLVVLAMSAEQRYEAAKADHAEAIGRLQDKIGGDGLGAIRNGQRRLGELMTDRATHV